MTNQKPRFEIIRTSAGFMPYDNDCDEFLYDEAGNNCFDNSDEAQALINDAVLTQQELACDNQPKE
jgi:hypothetical protein